jgi:succinoglycan biosynthesis protein ExoM
LLSGDNRGSWIMLISVGICTFKRPMVVKTIRSIFAQKTISPSDVEIIVCDDDPGASAQKFVMPLAKSSPMPVNYIISGARNIAVCRNACISAASGDWIAFIDDDETAEPDWLAELLAAQTQYSADVVKGFVRAVNPPETPSWIATGDPFTRDYGPTGTPLHDIGAGNVLFLREFAVNNGIAFDPKLGRTGSEDIDFFHRFRNLGANIVSSRTAIVNEIVPPWRVTPSSLSRRYRRLGRTHGRVFIPKRLFAARLRATSIAIVGVTAGAIYPLGRLAPDASALRFKLFRRFWFYLGVLEGIAGCQLMSVEP